MPEEVSGQKKGGGGIDVWLLTNDEFKKSSMNSLF